MEIINFTLDFVLILTSFLIIYSVRNLGGTIGSGVKVITWGMVVLGFSHLIETGTFQWLLWSSDIVEFSHRILVLVGFALIYVAFRQISVVK